MAKKSAFNKLPTRAKKAAFASMEAEGKTKKKKKTGAGTRSKKKSAMSKAKSSRLDTEYRAKLSGNSLWQQMLKDTNSLPSKKK